MGCHANDGRRARGAGSGIPGPGMIHEAPLPSLIAICITAAATVALFFWPDLWHDLMVMVVQGSAGAAQ